MIVRVLGTNAGCQPELFTYIKTGDVTTILANGLPLYSIERNEDGGVRHRAWHPDPAVELQIQDILSILNDLLDYGEMVFENEPDPIGR